MFLTILLLRQVIPASRVDLVLFMPLVSHILGGHLTMLVDHADLSSCRQSYMP